MKEANIPGLELLRKLQQEREKHLYKLYKHKQAGGIGEESANPLAEYKNAAEMYPVADAYLKAEAFEASHNPVKSAAGKKAKERILNGEDYQTVLNDMIAEANSK